VAQTAMVAIQTLNEYQVLCQSKIIDSKPIMSTAATPSFEGRQESQRTCSDDVFRALKLEQDLKCGLRMRCAGPTFREIHGPQARKEYCARILINSENFKKCVKARQQMTDECYGGGDLNPKHVKETKILEENGLGFCEEMYTTYCQ
jgi:hypothetical protein